MTGSSLTRGVAESPRRPGRPDFQLYEWPAAYQVAFGRSLRADLAFYEWAFRNLGSGDFQRLSDLGCGPGDLCIELAKRGYSVTGLDASESMLDFARTQSERAGVSCSFTKARLEGFKVTDSSDALFCMGGTVHHVVGPMDLESHLLSVNKAVRPGGLYFFDILVTREEDEPVELEQEWAVDQGKWSIHGRFSFPADGADLQRRQRLAELDVTVSDRGRQRIFSDLAPWRIFLESELIAALERHGFVLSGWYAQPPTPRRRVRKPHLHSSVLCVCRRQDGAFALQD